MEHTKNIINNFSENWKTMKNLYPEQYSVQFSLDGKFKTGREKYAATIVDPSNSYVACHDAMKLKSSKGNEYYMINKNPRKIEKEEKTKYEKICEYLTGCGEEIDFEVIKNIMTESSRNV